MKTKILALLVATLCVGTVRAQQTAMPVPSDSIGISLYFPKGYSILDTAFRENGVRVQSFIRRVRALQADNSMILRGVIIVSGASPEGNTELNRRLSDKRMEAVRSYMGTVCPDFGPVIRVISKGVNWEGLERMIDTCHAAWREEALAILRNTPEWVIENGRVADSRKRRLMRLAGGRAWHYMDRHFFPELRGGTVEVLCEFSHIQDATNHDIDTAEILIPATPDTTAKISVRQDEENPGVIPSADTVVRELSPDMESDNTAIKKRYSAGIYTNLLYDALLIPNIGVEFPFAVHWSVGANWMYGWKERHASRHRIYAYGGELHARYWLRSGDKLRERQLSGHHVGIYGQLLRYNIRTSDRGYVADRWSKGVGMEYGYSLPIGRFRIDMGIGIGYLTGICREYVRQDECDVWQATKRRDWFGPTKAEISLVWIIGDARKKEGGGK